MQVLQHECNHEKLCRPVPRGLVSPAIPVEAYGILWADMLLACAGLAKKAYRVAGLRCWVVNCRRVAVSSWLMANHAISAHTPHLTNIFRTPGQLPCNPSYARSASQSLGSGCSDLDVVRTTCGGFGH